MLACARQRQHRVTVLGAMFAYAMPHWDQPDGAVRRPHRARRLRSLEPRVVSWRKFVGRIPLLGTSRSCLRQSSSAAVFTPR